MAFSSHRLLLHNAVVEPDSAVVNSTPSSSAFDSNVEMIFGVFLCALVCAFGLNAIIRCALRLSGHSDVSLPSLISHVASRRRAIHKLPFVFYSPSLKLSGSSLVCAICLAEIEPGQRVRKLPNCGHGFHLGCIDRWLKARPTCPTCRQCLFTSRFKISSCVEPEVAVRPVIEPLEPERLEIGYLL